MIVCGTGFDLAPRPEIYDLAAAKPMGRSKGDGYTADPLAGPPAWGGGLSGKWPSIAVILFAQVTAMAVWFASAAAAFAPARSALLSGLESALRTSAVQAGFVCGTL